MIMNHIDLIDPRLVTDKRIRALELKGDTRNMRQLQAYIKRRDTYLFMNRLPYLLVEQLI